MLCLDGATAHARLFCDRSEVKGKMALPLGPSGGVFNLLLRCWIRTEETLLRALGLQPFHPALAIQFPVASPIEAGEDRSDNAPSFLDSIFWMAAPKTRRTIEVNRCRRRNPNKLIKEKNNIDQCLECGHLKLKHVLCGFCYEKVRHETHLIRQEIKAKEGGPFNSPTVESVVLYEGEKAHSGDEEKRIIERKRKRPSWFTNEFFA
ncbi:39S ribosomal protein L32, mitochondrial [Rana temporaria]|uniref:39S ribosomal protein L32, mitochondrial n=1 Tax=Rana temporaria TaxID=8407 RepID=UPI001AAD299B|nr:39S ribosomal protein L32, mitochondrial [Rana temporaria]